jgi:hypothetical protein
MIRFREEQRFNQPWIWAVVVGIALLEAGVFGQGLYQQLVLKRPWGDHPASDAGLIAIFCGVLALSVGLIALFVAMRLITEVRDDGLYVRFIPFHFKFHLIPLEDATQIEAVTYSPLGDYGGWGIRYGFKGKAYNVQGNRGVRLTFKEGRSLLIGSQKAEELDAALRPVRERMR